MKKIGLVTLAIATSSVMGFAQKATLDLSKTANFTYKTTSNTTITVEAMGQTQENVNNDEKTVEVTTKKEADAYKIEEKLVKLKASMQGMGQEKSYDSDSKNNDDEIAEIFADDLNQIKTYTVQMDGSTTNTTIAKVKKNEAAEAAKNAMGSMLNAGDNDLPFLSKNLLTYDIAVNNTWSDTTTKTKEKTTSKNITNYKVLSVENSIATIEAISDIDVTGTMEQMGMEMIIATKNKVKSVITLNTSTGMIVEKNGVIDITGNLEVMGMTIPVTGKSINMFKVTM